MFLSSYEVQARQIRQAAEQRDRVLKAQETAEPPTPGHAAAEGANECARANAEAAEAEAERRRIQHEVDPVGPYLHEGPSVDEVDLAELGKRYNQAFEVEFPADYPSLRMVGAEQFRRTPAPAGQPVPVPSATLAPGMISRPLLADGRSRPCAPGAC